MRANYITVGCIDCDEFRKKRRDSLKGWNGRCRSCAQKEVHNLPNMRKRAAESARLQVIRQGGIPNAKKFDGINNARENHPNWKGGITPENERLRSSARAKEWRIAVYIRDAFTCVVCGQVGGKLEAHHIKSWAQYPELRFCLDNGVTVCKDCHKEVLHGGAFHKKVVAIA